MGPFRPEITSNEGNYAIDNTTVLPHIHGGFAHAELSTVQWISPTFLSLRNVTGVCATTRRVEFAPLNLVIVTNNRFTIQLVNLPVIGHCRGHYNREVSLQHCPKAGFLCLTLV